MVLNHVRGQVSQHIRHVAEADEHRSTRLLQVSCSSAGLNYAFTGKLTLKPACGDILTISVHKLHFEQYFFSMQFASFASFHIEFDEFVLGSFFKGYALALKHVI